MSQVSKPVTLSGINDALLGVFSRFNNSDKLDHLLRYLGTWSGSDKLLMLIQYTAKLVIPFLELRARLQYRAKLRPTPTTQASTSLSKLASLIGDARTLGRIWGILPIIQWLVALEKSPPPTRTLLNIERLQGFSMLVYYPLEHLSYLLSHAIIPSVVTLPSVLSLLSSSNPGKARSLRLDAGKLGIWSVRAWAVYVVLQLLHLREDAALLRRRSKTLAKAKGKVVDMEVEKRDIRSRWDAWANELVVNLGYLPLTVHWSLEQGIFKNDAWVSLLGFIAAAASFRSGWKATASPPSAAPAISTQTEKEGTISERGFDDALAMPSLLIHTANSDTSEVVGYNAST